MFGRKMCDAESDKFDLCAPAGSACSPVDTKDTCEGDTLVYCDDGYVTKSDCTALGFTGCKPLTVGVMTLGASCI